MPEYTSLYDAEMAVKGAKAALNAVKAAGATKAEQKPYEIKVKNAELALKKIKQAFKESKKKK